MSEPLPRGTPRTPSPTKKSNPLYPLSTPVPKRKQREYTAKCTELVQTLCEENPSQLARRDGLESLVRIIQTFAIRDNIKLNLRLIEHQQNSALTKDGAGDSDTDEDEKSQKGEEEEDSEVAGDETTEDDTTSAVTSTDESADESKKTTRPRPLATRAGAQAALAVRSEQLNAKFNKLELALGADVDLVSLAEWRNRFRDAMMAVVYEQRKDRKVQETGFSDQQIIKLTNLFFSSMMGKSAIARVASIVAHANSGDDDGQDPGLATRAHNQATRAGMPTVCQIVFQEYEAYCNLTIKTNVATTAVMTATRQIQWFNSYNNLIEAVERGDPDVLKEFRKDNIKPKRGVGNASLVREWFHRRMDMSKNQIGNEVARADAINTLVQQHGHGVLILLPPNARVVFREAGVSGMPVALQLWHQTAGENMERFNAVCRWLGAHVYAKVFAGERIAFSGLSGRRHKSLMDKLLDTAAEPEEEEAEESESDISMAL